MQRVEGFFNNQVQALDAAVQLEDDLRTDMHYPTKETEGTDTRYPIRLMTMAENEP